jgi:hypothetical protein
LGLYLSGIEVKKILYSGNNWRGTMKMEKFESCQAKEEFSVREITDTRI